MTLPGILSSRGGLVPSTSTESGQRTETDDDAKRWEEQAGAVAAGTVALLAVFVLPGSPRPNPLPDSGRAG